MARLSRQYSLSPNSSDASSPKFMVGDSDGTQRMIRPSVPCSSVAATRVMLAVGLTVSRRSQAIAGRIPPDDVDWRGVPLERGEVDDARRMRCNFETGDGVGRCARGYIRVDHPDLRRTVSVPQKNPLDDHDSPGHACLRLRSRAYTA